MKNLKNWLSVGAVAFGLFAATFCLIAANSPGMRLASAKIFVGDSSGVAQPTTLTGDVTVNNTGVTAIGSNKITTAMLSATSQIGYIDLPLQSASILSAADTINSAGSLLALNTSPPFKALTASKEMAIQWAASSGVVIAWTATLPPDIDVSAAAVFKCEGKMSGATDTPTLTVAVFQGVNGTDAGGATSALSSTLGIVTKTLTAFGAITTNRNITVELNPGSHTTNAAYILSCWIEYTKL